MERDEEAIVGWRREVWPRVKHSRGNGGWICFLDESGQSLGPPKGRTWAPIGQTPIVQVSGKGGGRVSLAGLVCVKPGQRTRLIYRTIAYRGRRGEKKGFGIAELQALLTAAHRDLQVRLHHPRERVVAAQHSLPIGQARLVQPDARPRFPGGKPSVGG